MNLTEAKQILKKSGYSIIKEYLRVTPPERHFTEEEIESFEDVSYNVYISKNFKPNNTADYHVGYNIILLDPVDARKVETIYPGFCKKIQESIDEADYTLTMNEDPEVAYDEWDYDSIIEKFTDGLEEMIETDYETLLANDSKFKEAYEYMKKHYWLNYMNG